MVFVNTLIVSYMFLKAIWFCNEGSLQNDTAFLVPLVVFCCKFINPAKLRTAIFAGNVTHHVASSQHHSVLYFTVSQIHHALEEESSSCCSSEASGNQFRAICENSVAGSTRKQSGSSYMLQKYASHFDFTAFVSLVLKSITPN